MPYQERHLLIKVQLRNGQKMGLILYGGRGGGKNQRGSIVDLGNCLTFQVQTKNKQSTFFGTKEFELKWNPANIRDNYACFQLMCFFLEIMEKVSHESSLENLQDDLSLSNSSGDLNNFEVLSNSLFYLDKHPSIIKQNPYTCLGLFLDRLLKSQGVHPDLKTCSLTGNNLDPSLPLKLHYEQGAFSHFQSGADNKLFQFLHQCLQFKFQDFPANWESDKKDITNLWKFLCYQLQLNPLSLQTAKFYF